MTYLTILEKLKVLLDILLDYKLILISIIVLIILTILYLVKLLNKKKYTLSIILTFILTFTISIISNYKILSTVFDNFMTTFIRGIYFPSIYAYIITLFVVLITFIMTILSTKLPKRYKLVNIITFIINNIFLAIVLNIIAKNKIDVFSINSLYTNTNLVVVLELNIGMIILWILSLIVLYLTDAITLKLTSKKRIKPIENITINTTEDKCVESSPLAVKTEEVKEKKVLPLEVIDKKKEDTTTFNDILNGKLEVIYYDNNINNQKYSITDPQKTYESKYKQAISNNITLQDVLTTSPEVITIKPNKIKEEEEKIEEITKNTKVKNANDRLKVNTVSLDSLLEEVKELPKEDIKEEVLNKEIKDTPYTIEDYKLIVGMLKDIKNITKNSNITIEDAINISLISNHSIEDCLKFKEILESNLN